MQYKTFYTLVFCILTTFLGFAQKMSIQGHVFDAQSGELLPFAHVRINPGGLQTFADQDGYFNLFGLESGNFQVMVHYLGYDTLTRDISIDLQQPIYYSKWLLQESGLNLQTVEVNESAAQRLSDPNLATYHILPSEIEELPSLGLGDLSQYLAALPGVLRTGDLGGQLYIQGGDPSQNLILLDGIPVMNAFHTLNSFSIIPATSIRQASLYGNSFPAQYGGRISAVLDIKTINGRQNKINGVLGLDPFAGEIALNGPILKSKELVWKFLVNGRKSWIDQLANKIYQDIPGGIPFKFSDILLKSTVEANQGTSLSATYFRSEDHAKIADGEAVNWNNEGFGLNLQILPKNTTMIMGGKFAFSNYHIFDDSKTNFQNQIRYFLGNIWMQNAGRRFQLRYGFEVGGGRTEISFSNPLNIPVSREDNTSELVGFITYKLNLPQFILEAGLRMQYHAALSNLSPEPRIGIKWLPLDHLRLKAGGGRFGQNFISILNINDIANVRLGYITGPDRLLNTNHNLQKAWHLSGGLEWDILSGLLFSGEWYWKYFDQIVEINSEKRSLRESDFSLGSGKGSGLLSSLTWRGELARMEVNYSWGMNERTDLTQTFPAPFDRKHQINLFSSQKFGRKRDWAFIFRWNFGTGLPFTRTQGFYGKFDFDEGLLTDILKENPDLGILYENQKNQGRLPDFHRLDISLQKNWRMGDNLFGKITASVINIYNRKNLFYFDRINFARVNQLPVMPSLGFKLEWK